jgi:deoxyribodipyrimidine photo-lyase
MVRSFPASREAGLARLAAFTPQMGRAYAAGRNSDLGPAAAPATSILSPYLRRRLVLEPEAAFAALDAHGAAAEKFVQEVFWRGYFKGHLETRPGLWTAYQRLVAEGHDALAADPALRRRFEDAVAGRTGIDGFDDWARELVAANWLHNHTRMWFASIWIFTLRLPWALGADFFLRHLIDGDPASNTLSWRWVAGLHTKGKPYAARAENIRRYTGGRYNPAGLDEDPVALTEAEPAAAAPLPPAAAAPDGAVALLLHLDDLHPESLPLGRARVMRVGGLLAHAPGAADRVRQADDAAMADALGRAAAHFGCPAGLAGADWFGAGWAGGLLIVTAWAPVGPSATALPPCIRVRRPWDSLIWPHATRGYFQVKAAIPRILTALR